MTVTDDGPRHLAILLVESDAEQARAFGELLSSASLAREIETSIETVPAAAARSRLAQASFQLIVVSSDVGGEDGLALVSALRIAGVSTPILALTAKSGEEIAVETMRAGATDYLSKASLDAEKLMRAIRYALDLGRQAALREQAEAALQLREGQLRDSQSMETIATLSSGVAHEFNNQLNVIMGYGDMLRRRLPAGDPLHRHVEHILTAAEKATALTRHLAAFSRTQVLEPVVINTETLLKELGPVVRSVVGRRVELAVKIADGLGQVKADRAQIDHALMNLIVNARDAMPDGGTLTIEGSNVEVDRGLAFTHAASVRPGSYVMIAVSDTGHGMAAEVQSRAFEPFFTTKGRANATGLGLSTVFGIVRQSEGYVWLDSAAGRGTTLKLYLPRVDAGGRVIGLEPQPALPSGNEVVLLVDDQPTMREVVREALIGGGYSVLEADSGTEALRRAAEPGPIHVLLTDVMMPGMTGIELSAQLRKLRPTIKTIFMSGASKEAVRQRGGDPQAPFLWKPFTADELARLLRETLDAS